MSDRDVLLTAPTATVPTSEFEFGGCALFFVNPFPNYPWRCKYDS